MGRLRIRKLPDLHSAQTAIHQDRRRFRIVRAGRRFGKTRLGVLECIEVGLRGGLAWWVAPSYRLAGPGWRQLRRLARQIPGAKVNKSERMVELPGGGEVWVRTAADPDELRGEGLDFVVLDEAAYMSEEAWKEALRPALADKKGRALFISTPAGMVNWLSELWHNHEDDPDWGLHHYGSAANPHLDPAEVEEMRRDLGELLYRQEVLAEFVELEGTLIRAAWFRYFRRIVVHNPDETEQVLWRLSDGTVVEADKCPRYITVDPALSKKETADYTVFVVWAVAPDGRRLVVEVVRDRMEAPDVIDQAATLMAKWDAGWVGFEAVAYQTALVQFAHRAGLTARPLKADRDKVTRAMPLAAMMEDGQVEFMADAIWGETLEREVLLFPNGPHDDQVDALAYGTLARAETSGRRKWAAR